MLKIILLKTTKSLREMIFHLLNGTEGFMCVGAYPDASNLDFKIEKGEPDVVLMDIDLPESMVLKQHVRLKIISGSAGTHSVRFAEDEKYLKLFAPVHQDILLKTRPIKLL